METQIKNLKVGDKFRWNPITSKYKYPNGIVGEVISFDDVPKEQRDRWVSHNEVWIHMGR